MFQITRRISVDGIWQDAGTIEAVSAEAAIRPLQALPGDVLILEAPAFTDERLFFDVGWGPSGCFAVPA
ncbi:MAG TPA: hypothetical protein VG448_06030 [Solirubrobacterales bacterium]|nr:hypothetical protein [Solirubrobacterales bacterium]